MITKRLFLALNLPKNLKSAIADMIVILSNQNLGIKWVDPRNLHITLRFLGDIDIELEESVKIELEELERKFGEFIFSANKFSVFPNLQNPRVIFLDCLQKNGNTANQLQQHVKNICEDLGIKTDNKFWTPHITSGRVKEEGISVNIQDEFKNLPFEFSVNSFELMESELTGNGSIYKVVKSYKL
jgi:2'-5' RNA ligase